MTLDTITPDLRADADVHTLVSIVCLELQGARWRQPTPTRRREWGAVAVLHDQQGKALCLLDSNGCVSRLERMPDPLRDDEDAFGLMVSRGVWIEPVCDTDGQVTGWDGAYTLGAGACYVGPQPCHRTAVVLAVLHAAPEDDRLSLLIPALIERLEQAQRASRVTRCAGHVTLRRSSTKAR